MFGTSFSLLTIRVNLKQNDSSAVWFRANFKQQHSYSSCTEQVLSKTTNQSSLHIIYPTHQFRYIYSCALFFAQALGKTVRIFCQVVVYLEFRALFCTVFSFLSYGANFKKSNGYVERFDANFKQQHSCATTKVWRHKNEISEIMGFGRIFWKTNVQEAYLPKMSIWGQLSLRS